MGLAQVPIGVCGSTQTQRRLAVPARPRAHLVVTASLPEKASAALSKVKPVPAPRPSFGLEHLAPVRQECPRGRNQRMPWLSGLAGSAVLENLLCTTYARIRSRYCSSRYGTRTARSCTRRWGRRWCTWGSHYVDDMLEWVEQFHPVSTSIAHFRVCRYPHTQSCWTCTSCRRDHSCCTRPERQSTSA